MNLKSPCLAFLPTTENSPQAFGIPLSQVISNDRRHKQRHDPLREGHSDPTELMLSFLHLTSSFKRANKELSSSNSSMSSTSETPNDSPLPSTLDVAPRTRRRVRHFSKHAAAERQEICLITLAHEISLGICDFSWGGGCSLSGRMMQPHFITHCTVVTHLLYRAEYLWTASLTLTITSLGSWRPSSCLCQ